MKKYILRYTSDLYVINSGDDLDALVIQGRYSEYLVHILGPDGAIVWQNSKSSRYGTEGVEND